MMNVVNSAASILTVLAAARNTAKACYAYGLDVTNYPQELPKLREELESLARVLKTFGEIANSDCQVPTLRELCGDEGLLAFCLKELNSLLEKVAPSQGSQTGPRSAGLVQAMRWPLKETDVKKALCNIRIFNTTLCSALAADQR
jgi:hypothetical protein